MSAFLFCYYLVSPDHYGINIFFKTKVAMNIIMVYNLNRNNYVL
ncbi:hypothetical protein JOC75_003931 [Metabacillus crassostreae]|nr:hypothetical protein [Metabacillus crassostreae]